MSKHTPGPWEQHGNEIVGAEGTDRAFVICKLACGHITPAPVFDYLNPDMAEEYEETVAANAALIAAAPELLEALEAYVANDFEMGGDTAKAVAHNERLTRARAIIAKARGAQ